MKRLISYTDNFDKLEKGDYIVTENIAEKLVFVLSVRDKGAIEKWKIIEVGEYQDGEIFVVGKAWNGNMVFRKCMVGVDDTYKAEPSFAIPLGLNLKFYIQKKKQRFINRIFTKLNVSNK